VGWTDNQPARAEGCWCTVRAPAAWRCAARRSRRAASGLAKRLCECASPTPTGTGVTQASSERSPDMTERAGLQRSAVRPRTTNDTCLHRRECWRPCFQTSPPPISYAVRPQAGPVPRPDGLQRVQWVDVAGGCTQHGLVTASLAPKLLIGHCAGRRRAGESPASIDRSFGARLASRRRRGRGNTGCCSQAAAEDEATSCERNAEDC
jgi:hypothetical protein